MNRGAHGEGIINPVPVDGTVGVQHIRIVWIVIVAGPQPDLHSGSRPIKYGIYAEL